jgi:hypothetical protein
MVTLPHRSDPASCSRLGGALRTTAAGLAGHAADLATESAVMALTDALVRGADEVGAALQVHAQEVAEAVAAYERIGDRAAAVGLQLHAWKVSEPYGLAEADAARRRLLALPELQRQLNGLSGAVGPITSTAATGGRPPGPGPGRRGGARPHVIGEPSR